MYSATVSATPEFPLYSRCFQAPGRPLSADRRRCLRDRVFEIIEGAARHRGFALSAVTSAGGIELVEIDTGEKGRLGLRSVYESLIKEAASHLHADLLGGTNVTRLDVMCRRRLPRLGYDEALKIVNGRGHAIAHGERLTPAAMATLVSYCDELPVQVGRLPEEMDLAGLGDGVICVVPLAGETASLGATPDGRGVIKLNLVPLLQYFMGVGSAAEADVSF